MGINDHSKPNQKRRIILKSRGGLSKNSFINSLLLELVLIQSLGRFASEIQIDPAINKIQIINELTTLKLRGSYFPKI